MQWLLSAVVTNALEGPIVCLMLSLQQTACTADCMDRTAEVIILLPQLCWYMLVQQLC